MLWYTNISMIGDDGASFVRTSVWGWDTLSKQIIESIKRAESDAAARKSDAAERARAYLAGEKDAAKSGYDSAVANAKKDMEDKLDLIQKQSEALIAKNRAEAEADAAKETEIAVSHMDAAVEIIIGELVKNVGK